MPANDPHALPAGFDASVLGILVQVHARRRATSPIQIIDLNVTASEAIAKVRTIEGNAAIMDASTRDSAVRDRCVLDVAHILDMAWQVDAAGILHVASLQHGGLHDGGREWRFIPLAITPSIPVLGDEPAMARHLAAMSTDAIDAALGGTLCRLLEREQDEVPPMRLLPVAGTFALSGAGATMQVTLTAIASDDTVANASLLAHVTDVADPARRLGLSSW
jgi:hypothetical protein